MPEQQQDNKGWSDSSDWVILLDLEMSLQLKWLQISWSIRSVQENSSTTFQHYASQHCSALEALGADVSYCLQLLTAETLILNTSQFCVYVYVCVCTLSDLIRLYLWWCLTPLRAWQLLPFLSLSAFISVYSFSLSLLSHLPVFVASPCPVCLPNSYSCLLWHFFFFCLSRSLSSSVY